MKTKEIKFLPQSKVTEEIVEPPKPAKNFIPSWYKKIPPFKLETMSLSSDGRVGNTNVKMCMPFLDAMTSGYIQTTWTDIHIDTTEDNVINYSWLAGPEPINVRPNSNIPHDEEVYHRQECVWINQYNPVTPKGYSILVTHPFNMFDLPFRVVSGIVDSDLFNHTQIGRLPFYIKKGFKGVIPLGTPMFQIIPIKRESWQSVVEPYNETEVNKKNTLMAREFYGVYKKLFWQKKDYR